MKYLAPNAFTAASLLCGLASIVLTVEGRFVDAAWFALYCVLLDKVDGFAARLLGAQSRFGAQFDSFADQVGFGIAPAVLFLSYFTEHPEYGLAQGLGRLALLVGAGVYVVGNAARLARYNISESDPRYFQGVPTTLAGGFLCALFLTCLKYGAQPSAFQEPRLLGSLHIGAVVLRGMPVYLVMFGLLMVSQVRIPKLTHRTKRVWNLLQVPNVAAVYVFGAIQWFPEYMFALALAYFVIGVIVGRLRGAPPSADEHVGQEAGAAR